MHEEKNKALGEPISGKLAICAFVERSHLFKGLEQEDLDNLYQTGRLLVYEPDDVIYREGDPSTDLYLLMIGTVQVSTTSNQHDVDLEQLSRGAVIGVVGALSGRPRTTTVTALDHIELIAFHRKSLEKIILNYPKIKKLLRTMFEAQLRRAIERAGSENP